MLDLNQIRADFAAHLARHAATRHSLDAALMHVVESAYQKGLADALQVPPVLRHPITDLDPRVAIGNGGTLAAGANAAHAPGIPDAARGARQSGNAESGNDAPVRAPVTDGAHAR